MFDRWSYQEYDGTAAGDDRRVATVPGHSWITGARAPAIPGYRCVMVNHYGTERTEFVYRPAG